MFANFFGLKDLSVPTQIMGTMILAAILISVATFLWFLWRHRTSKLAQDDRNRALIIVCLTAYTLLFCVNTAYGRLCVGFPVALQSRYVIYLEPAVLGFYFFLLGLRHAAVRKVLLSGFLAAVVAASFYRDRGMMGVIKNIKQGWKTCYLQSEDIDKCDKVVGFPIYSPSSRQTQQSHLQRKLEYLKRTRQNFYSD